MIKSKYFLETEVPISFDHQVLSNSLMNFKMTSLYYWWVFHIFVFGADKKNKYYHYAFISSYTWINNSKEIILLAPCLLIGK